MSSDELIFVYNADTGLFNQLADAAHKAFSPDTYACNLCRVTYGLLTEKKAWRDFVASLGVQTSFLHRNEMRARFPELDIALPAVLSHSAGGEPRVCIDAETLNRCESVEALSELVRDACLSH
ncbi:hypothetical protein [Halochromatium sp.]